MRQVNSKYCLGGENHSFCAFPVIGDNHRMPGIQTVAICILQNSLKFMEKYFSEELSPKISWQKLLLGLLLWKNAICVAQV